MIATLGICLNNPFRPTYAEGLERISDSVAALLANLDPPSRLPSPRDGGYSGSCDGLDKDPDGQTTINRQYHLGEVPLHVSDWQTRRTVAG